MPVTVKASRSKLIVPSGFNNYDLCLNPYVGCGFGCTYCYVRFFVKDKNHGWGGFVRTRDHVHDKLEKELTKANGHEGKRIVIGTMTDPYQPQERRSRLTRSALKTILEHGRFSKVGIFTRSPIVLDDIDLIARLPKARVHYTITPFRNDVLRLLEPVPIRTERRFDAVKKLIDAGIRVHLNVSPILPTWSEPFIVPFTMKISGLGVSEFFVDPMQPYRESFNAVFDAVSHLEEWPTIRDLMLDKDRYNEWKDGQGRAWTDAWRRHGDEDTLAIWCDHQRKIWRNMSTGQQMDHRLYGDDL